MSLPSKDLNDKVGYHTPVIRVHAWTISVEDSRHFDGQPVLAPIVEKQGFSASLSFIVTRPGPNRIDMPPIVFCLGMHIRVTINFGRGGLQDFSLNALCQAKHIDCAMHTGFRRLHRVTLVMNRRGWACQIVDLINLDIEWKRHVMTN
jgi:hypothetical protein